MLILFEAHLKLHDTATERFVGDCYCHLTLHAEFIRARFDCEKEDLTENELLGGIQWEKQRFMSDTIIARKKLHCISMEYKEEIALWRVYVAGVEDFYLNVFLKNRSRAERLSSILTKWLFTPDDRMSEFIIDGEFKSDKP